MEVRLSASLSGNLASVLCCAASPHSSTLATGAEDGAVATFDLGTAALLCRLIIPATDAAEADAVTSVAFHPSDPASLFASAATAVHRIDLRTATASGIVRSFDVASDEIGAVAVDGRGTYLAAGDDTGAVHVVDLAAGRVFKTIRGAHENICGTLAFRPHRPWELLSGGLDNTVARWDFSRGRCLQRWRMGTLQEAGRADGGGSDEEPEEEGSERQLFNPPMVHHLAVPPTPDRRWCSSVALACGDGTLVVLDADQAAASTSGRDAAAPASAKGAAKAKPKAPAAAASSRGGRPASSRRDEQRPTEQAAAPAVGGGGGAGQSPAGRAAAVSGTRGPTGGRVLLLGRRGDGHTRPASCVCWAHVDGRWHAASAGQDKRLLLWDVEAAYLGLSPAPASASTGGEERSGGVSAAAAAGQVASAADGQGLAGGLVGQRTGSATAGRPVARAALRRKPNGMCCTPEGQRQLLCVADTGRTVALYDVVRTTA